MIVILALILLAVATGYARGGHIDNLTLGGPLSEAGVGVAERPPARLEDLEDDDDEEELLDEEEGVDVDATP